MLRSTPGLTLTAVFTLAVGIAANTTVFGWIDGLLLDPIPGAARSHDLVTVETVTPNGDQITTGYRDYRDYRDSLQQFSGLAASLANVFTVGDQQNPKLVWGEFVTSNYFSVLGVDAARGRTLLSEESSDAPGGAPVVIISDRLWKSIFNRDPRAVGRTLRVNHRELTIVGVASSEFRGAVPGLVLELWIPVSLAPELNGQGPWLLEDRDERQMWITGRLRPGAAIEQARAEVVACARRMAEANPSTNRGFSATVLPVWRGHVGGQHLLRAPLQILMAACLLLFLIVGANVANLQLARAASREKEFGIRLALGARPARVMRQLLTESLLLSALGAIGGLLLTMWSRDSLAWLMPPVNFPLEVSAKVSWRVLMFVSLACIAAAVLSGLAPALHAVRDRVNVSLKDGVRGSTAGAGSRRTRSWLVVSEVALAMVALVGAGVLVRTFFKLRGLNPGMNVHNVACVKYYVATFCRTSEERRQFCMRAAQRLLIAPGVSAVSYTNRIPLEFGDGPHADVEVQGYVPAANESMRTANSSVSSGYFNLLGIPVLEGREFLDQDTPESARVMIVNQSFARRYFGGGRVLGRTVRTFGQPYTVIGLVRDSKYAQLNESPSPHFFTASRQTSGGEFWMAFFVRTDRPVEGALAALSRQAAEINPATRSSAFVPYQALLSAALYPQWVIAALVGFVGVICLMLAAVGLYGVMSFAVNQRLQEFGIRVALGARPLHVLSAVLRQAMRLTAVGMAAGLIVALAVLKTSSGFVPKTGVNDLPVLGGAVLVLCLVGTVASYLPARRASRVDPSVALRRE